MREVMHGAFVVEKFLLERRRQNFPLFEAVFNQFAQVLRNCREPFGAVGRRFAHERDQIPLQFGRAQP